MAALSGGRGLVWCNSSGGRPGELEVFLTGTARTRQCLSESDPARDRQGHGDQ